ncbi:Hypothetical protein SMAX5B_012757, partial [Scophthalmus maximus]
SFAFTHASNMSKQNPRISTHSHDADTSDVRRIPTLIGFRYIAVYFVCNLIFRKMRFAFGV